MDLVQRRGPWTPGPSFVLTQYFYVYGLSEKYLRRTESALRLSLDNNTETNPEHFDDCSEIPRTQSKGPMF